MSVVDTSNLDGVPNPVQEIIKIAHQYGAKVLLDAAQECESNSEDCGTVDPCDC